MKWNARTKRNIAIGVFALLGAANAPILGDLLAGIYNYDIYAGLMVSKVLGILGLIGAWMLYKKHF